MWQVVRNAIIRLLLLRSAHFSSVIAGGVVVVGVKVVVNIIITFIKSS